MIQESATSCFYSSGSINKNNTSYACMRDVQKVMQPNFFS